MVYWECCVYVYMYDFRIGKLYILLLLYGSRKKIGKQSNPNINEYRLWYRAVVMGEKYKCNLGAQQNVGWWIYHVKIYYIIVCLYELHHTKKRTQPANITQHKSRKCPKFSSSYFLTFKSFTDQLSIGHFLNSLSPYVLYILLLYIYE